MTTHADTLRALADQSPSFDEIDEWYDDVKAALRAAADREDAVRRVADYLRDERWDQPGFDPESMLRAILTPTQEQTR